MIKGTLAASYYSKIKCCDPIFAAKLIRRDLILNGRLSSSKFLLSQSTKDYKERD